MLSVEIEKLARENKVLRSPFSRPAAWVPVVVAVVSIGSLWVQWTTSSLREQQAALEAAEKLAAVKAEREEAEAAPARVEGQLHEYRIEFLRNVVKNLNDTAAAVQAYSRENWRQVIVLRDGNRAVEELLTLILNVGLLPPSLTDDLGTLREHYREWSRAYEIRFPDGVPRPQENHA